MQQAGWVVSEREDEGSNKSTNKENREQTRKIRLEESEQKTETTDYFSTPCFFLVKLWINDNTSQFHNSHEIPGLHAVQSPIVSYQSARLARGPSVARTLLPARTAGSVPIQTLSPAERNFSPCCLFTSQAKTAAARVHSLLPALKERALSMSRWKDCT